MKHLIWVGNKLSDIRDCTYLFKKTINLYGRSGTKDICMSNLRCNNNKDNSTIDEYILNALMLEISLNSETQIMFYNPKKAYKYGNDIIKRTTCLNDLFLLELLSDKISCHDLFKNEINFAPYITVIGKHLNYTNLRKVFPQYDKFVLQKSKGSGGYETYVLTQNNANDVLKYVNMNERYLVSCYIENNIPINFHVIIGNNDSIIFPPSKQIIQNSESRLIYRGADFINIDFNVALLAETITPIVNKLQRIGYRGILGMDLILDTYRNITYLAEINCRFQGSSFLINKALKKHKCPSLQELNILAFSKTPISNLLPTDLNIPLACLVYYKNECSKIQLHNARIMNIEDDNLQFYQTIEPYAYLFKEIYEKA